MQRGRIAFGIVVLAGALLVPGSDTRAGGGTWTVLGAELRRAVSPASGPDLAADVTREAAALGPASAPFAAPAPAARPAPPWPPAIPPRPLRPSVLPADFPDPTLYWGGDRWYAVATNGGGRHVQLSSSPDLRSWTAPVEAVPGLPPWTEEGVTWAPSVTRIGAQWVLYASFGNATNGSQCLDRLVSAAPGGPFVPVADRWLLCDETGGTGAIDPAAVIAPDGRPYLVWKAAGSRSNQVWAAPLTPDGLELAGDPVSILSASAGWEGGGVENPSLVPAGRGWLLLYSGGWWTSAAYAMGWSRCDAPLGPCRKATSNGPWIASRGPVVGPGGGSIAIGPDGTKYLAYHSWDGGPGYGAGGRRVLHVERLDLSGGAPALADAPPVGSISGVGLQPDGVAIAGQAFDPDVAGSIFVTLLVNGWPVLGRATEGRGFATTIPLREGDHEVCLAAHDDLQQSFPTLGCTRVAVPPGPIGALDALTPLGGGRVRVSGWALDPRTTAAIPVELRVGGRYVDSSTTTIARSDVAAAWPAWGAAHGFVVDVPAESGQPVCAYGVPAGAGPATRLGCATA